MQRATGAHYAIAKLAWMREQGIWPNGLRYLWTDAFGLVLFVSLYAESGERKYLDQAESLVAEVVRILGRPRGVRIGEAPDREPITHVMSCSSHFPGYLIRGFP
jgi:hypothetical protein